MKQLKKIEKTVLLLMILSFSIGVLSCSKSDENETEEESTAECTQHVFDLYLEMTLASQAYGENATAANCQEVKEAANRLIAYAETAPCTRDGWQGDEEVYQIAEMNCP